jgi:endonuclease YncB( thermonuclease family)
VTGAYPRSSAQRLVRARCKISTVLRVTSKLTLIPLLLLTANLCAEEITGKVIGITDGDTLTVFVGTTPTKVRLAEIDTPEIGQQFGNRAKQGLSNLVFGKTIRVVVTDRDRYGREVGRLYLGELDVNKEMVRQGLAWAYLQYQTDTTFSALEAEARDASIGLWSLPEDQRRPPWTWRREGEETADPAGSGCRIKGNINRKGRKLYHVPGSPSYGPTKIDRSKGERWFCSEAEALAAGWSKP